MAELERREQPMLGFLPGAEKSSSVCNPARAQEL